MSTQFGLVIFLTWQLLFAQSLPVDEDDYEIRTLTPEEAEQLATWTEDSKQNIWELSGQFEGDMVLSKDQRNGLIKPSARWPNREIPYKIDSVFTKEQKQWITKSLTEYNNKTCIKPRLRNSTDKDYVYITGRTTGCHSKIGRRGGKQNLNLQPSKPGTGCLTNGTIVHEFLHALGFYHEQSSTDRDDYVTIVNKNIKLGKGANFKKYPSNVITSFGQKYDYSSVMHYSAYAFSKNGNKTIITKDPKAKIGQRVGLSKTDIVKLNKMYGCT